MAVDPKLVRRIEGTIASPAGLQTKQHKFDVGDSSGRDRTQHIYKDSSTFEHVFITKDEIEDLISDGVVAGSTSVFALAENETDFKSLAESALDLSIVCRGVEITDSAYELNFVNSKRIYLDGENGIFFSDGLEDLTSFFKFPTSNATQDIKIEFIGRWYPQMDAVEKLLYYSGGYSGNPFTYSISAEYLGNGCVFNPNTSFVSSLYLYEEEFVDRISINKDIVRIGESLHIGGSSRKIYKDDILGLVLNNLSSGGISFLTGDAYAGGFEGDGGFNVINNIGGQSNKIFIGKPNKVAGLTITNTTRANSTDFGECFRLSCRADDFTEVLSITALHEAYFTITGNNANRNMLFIKDTNTGIGNGVLDDNNTGLHNTGVGKGSIEANIDGGLNTALGSLSLRTNTTGNANTSLGYGSLPFTNYDNTTGLGANSEVTGSNQVQLGDSATTTYAYGAVQNRSDERDKADIRETVLGLDFINAVTPVDYKWDMREDYREVIENKEIIDGEEKVTYEVIEHERDGSKKRSRYHHGFIAQQLRDCGYEFGGFQDHSINGGEDVLSVGYEEMIAPLVKAVQELTQMNRDLTERIEVLENI